MSHVFESNYSQSEEKPSDTHAHQRMEHLLRIGEIKHVGNGPVPFRPAHADNYEVQETDHAKHVFHNHLASLVLEPQGGRDQGDHKERVVATETRQDFDLHAQGGEQNPHHQRMREERGVRITALFQFLPNKIKTSQRYHRVEEEDNQGTIVVGFRMIGIVELVLPHDKGDELRDLSRKAEQQDGACGISKKRALSEPTQHNREHQHEQPRRLVEHRCQQGEDKREDFPVLFEEIEGDDDKDRSQRLPHYVQV